MFECYPSLVLNPIRIGGAQCAHIAVIALKTQKNEKKILKKYKLKNVLALCIVSKLFFQNFV